MATRPSTMKESSPTVTMISMRENADRPDELRFAPAACPGKEPGAGEFEDEEFTASWCSNFWIG